MAVPNDPIFLQVAVPTALRQLFDYLPPEGIDPQTLIPGQRVKIPFQARTLVGILMAINKNSSLPYEKLKRAVAVLDTEPLLPSDLLTLCQWAADYYHHALGDIFTHALPVGLRKRKGRPGALPKEQAISEDALALNAEQSQAVTAITSALGRFQPFLLEGVTGSGKTEVYLQAIAEVLAKGQQVLVLVPEISLTPQTLARFQARFKGPVAMLHSSLVESERLAVWLGALQNKVQLVIGTRSAIFTPFANLGLIVVDEEHDSSFKQQDRFRYHARDLAVKRASLLNIPIVLGSATPALESLLNAARGRYQLLVLKERAGNANLPQFRWVDLRNETLEAGLSQTLLNSIQEQLTLGNQVMLFLNRRGFSPVWYCAACAWIANCERCDARMVYHREAKQIRCHHCDARKPIPKTCPSCHAADLQPVGVGTQRLEETLAQHFKGVPIIRLDRDTTRLKGSMTDLLASIQHEQKAIILGTQMIAKGHHFPRVTLVGIIDADGGLFSADYRAVEQMGQLLLQVAGRAGRADQAGTVIVQTRHPDHPMLQTLIHEGYPAFANLLLAERQTVCLPPYTYFAAIRAEGYSAADAERFLKELKRKLSHQQIDLLGPVAATMAKRKGFFCQQLIFRCEHRSLLQQHLKHVMQYLEKLPRSKVKWALDVDPYNV